jgi:hypothetical protein
MTKTFGSRILEQFPAAEEEKAKMAGFIINGKSEIAYYSIGIYISCLLSSNCRHGHHRFKNDFQQWFRAPNLYVREISHA